MIEISDIFFKYDEEKSRPFVLNGISLDIRAGESIAIIGPNGSGKSTLAKCLNCLLVPSKGSVVVDGLHTSVPENALEIRRRVSMLFQNPDNQIVSVTVEREIAFGLENIGMPYEEMHALVDRMLSRFDLEPYRHKSPHYLSGGEKQRLALAAVLAMQPRYLVLDEPTSLLDPKSRKDILNIIKGLHSTTSRNGAAKITTLLVTQFPEEALVADRLIVLNEGRIYRDGPPADIFKDIDGLTEIGLESPVTFRLDKLLSRYQSTR